MTSQSSESAGSATRRRPARTEAEDGGVPRAHVLEHAIDREVNTFLDLDRREVVPPREQPRVDLRMLIERPEAVAARSAGARDDNALEDADKPSTEPLDRADLRQGVGAEWRVGVGPHLLVAVIGEVARPSRIALGDGRELALKQETEVAQVVTARSAERLYYDEPINRITQAHDRLVGEPRIAPSQLGVADDRVTDGVGDARPQMPIRVRARPSVKRLPRHVLDRAEAHIEDAGQREWVAWARAGRIKCRQRMEAEREEAREDRRSREYTHAPAVLKASGAQREGRAQAGRGHGARPCRERRLCLIRYAQSRHGALRSGPSVRRA